MTALTDHDLERLQQLLQGLPAPLEPLDVSALDGYLCGVLLQPHPVAEARWLPRVADAGGAAAPASADLAELNDLVRRRRAELARAIDGRRWFDPWLFQLEDDAPVRDSVLPWVAGFALAMELFPALLALDAQALTEPLALLYLHLDADDLEADPALQAAIEAIEPPADLAEAAEDLVRAVLLLADASRPLPARRNRPRVRTRH
jgi:uncharacterized protein